MIHLYHIIHVPVQRLKNAFPEAGWAAWRKTSLLLGGLGHVVGWFNLHFAEQGRKTEASLTVDRGLMNRSL